MLTILQGTKRAAHLAIPPRRPRYPGRAPPAAARINTGRIAEHGFSR